MLTLTTSRPLEDAVADLGQRTPLRTALSSAQLAALPQEIRDVAFFSAHMANERILAAMQTRILQRLSLERSKLPDGGEGVTMDRARFIAEMQEVMEAEGYRPEPGTKGTIKDHSSAGRLGLIWDMQMAMARGYAQHVAAMDADLLDSRPAYELIRGEERMVERDWPQIWRDNGGTFYGTDNPDYPGVGRMIALKTDPIWIKISEFGKPWTPLRWGSGMIKKVIRRRESDDLGVTQPGQMIAPVPLPPFGETTVSIVGFSPEGEERTLSTFGETVRFPDEIPGEAIPAPAPTPAPGGVAPSTPKPGKITFTPPPSGEGVEAHLDRIGKNFAKDALESGEDRPEVIAPLAAVANGRVRAAVIDEPEPTLASWLPETFQLLEILGKAVVTRAGQTLPAIPNEATLYRLAGRAQKGTGVPAVILGPEGKRITIEVPKRGAKTYALARVRDYLLAFGNGWRLAMLDGKEVPR